MSAEADNLGKNHWESNGYMYNNTALLKEAKEETRDRQKIKHSVTMIGKYYYNNNRYLQKKMNDP